MQPALSARIDAVSSPGDFCCLPLAHRQVCLLSSWLRSGFWASRAATDFVTVGLMDDSDWSFLESLHTDIYDPQKCCNHFWVKVALPDCLVSILVRSKLLNACCCHPLPSSHMQFSLLHAICCFFCLLRLHTCLFLFVSLPSCRQQCLYILIQCLFFPLGPSSRHMEPLLLLRLASGVQQLYVTLSACVSPAELFSTQCQYVCIVTECHLHLLLLSILLSKRCSNIVFIVV